MKAVTIVKPGGPESLVVSEEPEPTLAKGHLLIDVRATALNRADLMQRRGLYPPPPGAPPYPGLECAGVILAGEAGTSGWPIGQRVMALLAGGGYAERVAVPEETVMPIPEGLSFEQAAAIPEAWLTAYSNMIEIGRLAPGERVLIHAGASGVGSAAIQLAKWKGATVFTTASGGKLKALRALGADVTIDYQKEDFASRIAELTGGEGVELIVDFVGAPYLDANLRALSPWGRLTLVGLLGGRQATIDLGLLLSKKLSIFASTLRDRSLAEKGRLVRAFAQDALPAFSTGDLRPILDPERFTLQTITEAHRYMESNANVGKIVVTVP